MGYKSGADGVAKKGKTSVEVFPTDGPKVTNNAKAKKGGGLNASYKAVGRNMARANNQRGR
jgi:hypothetical protein